VIAQPAKVFERYIHHRQARHQRVLEAVSGTSTLSSIASEAYSDTPDAHPGLAEDQTLSHLLAHQRDGLVEQRPDGWHRIDSPQV
jgi:hypothetical protein